MKFAAAIFLLVFLIASGAAGQKQYLTARNWFTKNEIAIREGRHLQVRTLDGRLLVGRFEIRGDSTILLASDSVHLKDIAFIKIHPVGTQIAGFSLTGISGILIGSSSLLIKKPKLGEEWGTLFPNIFGVMLLGLGVATAVPGVTLIFINKQLSAGKWEFGIRKVN